MKFGIHGPQRMNPNDFDDPLTFHQVPSSGQKSNCVIQVFDQIPAKLKTFPSASAVLCAQC